MSSNDVLTESLENLVKKVIEDEGITEAKIEIKPGSEKGDNYVGLMTCVDIYGLDKSGKKITLNLMAKRAPESDALRANVPIVKIYEREIYFYNGVVPIFEKFQEDLGVEEKFTSVAKCYANCLEEKKEALIFEHLGNRGYKMWNRFKPMNEEHVKIIMDTYAHLHALSFAMRDQRPELFEEIKEKCTDQYTEEEISKFGGAFRMNCEMLIESFQDNPEIVKYLRGVKDGLEEMFAKSMVLDEERSIFTHGDCWCNNMMFTYEGTTPKSVILLDWQVAKIGTIFNDLCYFFYCSSSQEIYDNYQSYQRYYYDRLSHHLKLLGSDFEKFYTFESFQETWKEYRHLGLLLSMFIMRIMVTQSDEAIDMAEWVESGEDFFNVFNCKTKNEQLYLKRIKGLLDHLIATE